MGQVMRRIPEFSLNLYDVNVINRFTFAQHVGNILKTNPWMVAGGGGEK